VQNRKILVHLKGNIDELEVNINNYNIIYLYKSVKANLEEWHRVRMANHLKISGNYF
jgi:hypothetical protein